jgi:hypothetical protein
MENELIDAVPGEPDLDVNPDPTEPERPDPDLPVPSPSDPERPDPHPVTDPATEPVIEPVQDPIPDPSVPEPIPGGPPTVYF